MRRSYLAGQDDAGVPQLRLDGLEVGASGVGEAGRAVPQVMEPHRREPRVEDEAAEAAGQPVRVQRRAVRFGEQVSGVLPPVPSAVLLGLLPAAVLAQQPHGGSIEGDGAAAGGGFRRADVHGAAVGDALLRDGERAGVQIHVAPAQSGCFAAA
jgi:hypothetical protein